MLHTNFLLNIRLWTSRSVRPFPRDCTSRPKLIIYPSVNPPLIFGPFHEHFLVPPTEGLGPNRRILRLVQGNVPPTLPPHFVDVRDVAFAHLRALALPLSLSGERKRYLISAGIFPWIQAMNYCFMRFPNAPPNEVLVKRHHNLPLCKMCGDSLELVPDTGEHNHLHVHPCKILTCTCTASRYL